MFQAVENLSDLRALEGLTAIRKIRLKQESPTGNPERASKNAGPEGT